MKKSVPVGHIYLHTKGLGDLSEFLVRWAVQELIDGNDKSSVIELAGYTNPINPHELNQTLVSVCTDLSVDLSNEYRNIVAFIGETAQRHLIDDLTLDECRESIHWATSQMDLMDSGVF